MVTTKKTTTTKKATTAKTEKDVYRLCHYTNLQLLNAKDNLIKSDKLDFVL